jgi:hypothetical protein
LDKGYGYGSDIRYRYCPNQQNKSKKRLHPAGIEPTTLAWKANILPLNYGCFDPWKTYLLAVTITLYSVEEIGK